MSGGVLDDAKALAQELALAASTGSIEWYLLENLRPLIISLENSSTGRAQQGAVNRLSRFCTDSLDWTSPLVVRCSSIVDQSKPVYPPR